MKLLSRNLNWQPIIAETAEKFTAMNAIQSSGFSQALGANIINELEERCKLFLAQVDDSEEVTTLESSLRMKKKILVRPCCLDLA